jgi:hypothetical protein
MWWVTTFVMILIGVCFVQFFGSWSIKQGWYDDLK